MNDGALSHVLPCGCNQIASTGAWSSCEQHQDDHPGGHESWDTYRAAWAHVECCVCHIRGIHGRNDFESVWIGTGMMYAHRSCYALATTFADMRPDDAWVNAYRKTWHL